MHLGSTLLMMRVCVKIKTSFLDTVVKLGSAQIRKAIHCTFLAIILLTTVLVTVQETQQYC